MRAYRTAAFDESGKRGITFNPHKATNEVDPFELPCGICTGCRLERARQWSIRMMHEARGWSANAFVTLTFSDEHLPADYGVHVEDVQKFMKRLRKSLPQKVRFFACGEYGDLHQRPHYHLILFNHQFPDLKPLKKTPHGMLYTSQELSKLWPYGQSSTGAVTHKSAGYVARYSLKKIGGDKATDHYTRIHPVTRAINVVRPEFCVMSRKPGIGASFMQQFKSDLFPSGYLIVDGHKVPPPRFYLNQLEEHEREYLANMPGRPPTPSSERTLARRRVRAEVRDARIKSLQRNL